MSVLHAWYDAYTEANLSRVNVQGARASVNFYGKSFYLAAEFLLIASVGNAVTVFGAVSDNHGTYTVSLDGRAAQTFTGAALESHYQQVLVRAPESRLPVLAECPTVPSQ